MRWAERLEPQPGGLNEVRYDYYCRSESGPERGSVTSADYHYVEGEEQRHDRLTGETDDD
jgi:hypothetical protein